MVHIYYRHNEIERIQNPKLITSISLEIACRIYPPEIRDLKRGNKFAKHSTMTRNKGIPNICEKSNHSCMYGSTETPANWSFHTSFEWLEMHASGGDLDIHRGADTTQELSSNRVVQRNWNDHDSR